MTFEKFADILREVGLPFAYHHFAEGESPNPPFLIYLSPGEDNFSADNWMYYAFTAMNVELYTDRKSPETEKMLEEIFAEHKLFYTKTETYIEEEKLFEVLYEMEVI